MAKCLKPNFSVSQYSGDINLTKLTGETPEALVEEIYARLKGLPFSTSIDESQNEDLYLESVKLLVNTVVNKLKDVNPDDKKTIRELLKSKLSPRPLTQVEERIQAVIEGTDLISEQDRRAITYKAILNNFYQSGNLGVDLWRQMLFTDLMLVRTIIDASKRLIIDSDETLNQGIINYQSELYKIVRDYLLKYVFTNPDDSKLFSTNLYVTNPKTKVKTKVSNYANALQAMYNVITDKQKKGTFQSELELSWANAILYKSSDFYNAVSAYINLAYFDDVLYESLGDFIIVDNNLDTPITAELNDLNKYEIKYKYKLRKGNTNNKKNFGVEFQDSLDLMSKFSKVLINSIPIYDYRTGQREFGKMLPKDFIGTWTRLKDVGTRVNDNEFVEAIISLHEELSRISGSLKTIYNKLFNNKYNSTLLKKLNELGFDLNNLNVLYSFYKTAMYGENSWLSIENDYLKNKGIRPRYNLIESLFNVISSNSSMNYLQTTYDSYNDLYETKVKDKYSISLNRFDIVKDINSTTIDREDSLDYEIVRMTDLKSYMINIDDNNYFINIPTSTHLLAKKDALNNYLTPELNKLNVDISTQDKREHLINGTDLTPDEIKFKQVLNFLDNMLHTSFSKDTQGLLELYLASLTDKNFLKGAFLSASRALLIRNIYKGFRSAKKEDGSTYAQNELRLYLRDNPDVYPIKIANYSESRDINEFFIKSYNGYQLKTVLDREDWIMNLAKIRTILAGNTSKSVISNLDGDKVPNFSPTFLGAEPKSQIAKSGSKLNINFPTLHLLFSKFPNALIETVEDTDVRTKEGIIKLVKNMTEGELLYHSIIDKFLIPLVLNKTVYILPTVYSDKTKYINGHISLEDMTVGDSNLYNIMFSPNMLSLIEQLMINTVGNTYKEIYNNVIEDYLKIFPGKTDLEIANELKKLNENLLILLVTLYNKSHNTNLVFYRDLHYREVVGGKLALNELLYEFAKNLYTPERLHNRLEKEKREYINDLLLKRIHIPYTDVLQEALKKFVDIKELDKWTSNGKIVLARAYNPETKTWRKVINGRIRDNETIEINPMLNAVFMYDNLLGNNLRYSLSASEINHKIKSLKKLNLLNKINRQDFSNMRKLMPGWKGENITFLDLYNMIHTNMPKDDSMLETILRLSKVYDDNIYMLENLGLNALFKRNVAITATMTRMIPNLYGITLSMNIACMNDVPAKVFNFDGKIDKIDAHDGSALVIPFWAILENKSLSDNEVGTIKKPIHHYYNDRYMTATLLKYATDAITNLWMRLSEGNSNGIRLRDIFKKATRVRWHDTNNNWRFGEIDLIDGCAFKKDPNIDFKNDICDGLNLYYRNGNTHFLIYNFGIENGIYYTDEQEVDNIGKAKAGKNPIRKYHYFNNNQEHVPSNTILTDTAFHTIDSLFELHTALGGIYSESLNADGNLLYSEASNYAVTNFINLVSNLKPNANPRDISPVSYDLPLKRAMIHMIANNSAIKNGAGNMNPVSSWYDNTDLNYMTIGTEWYGIQLDSDHTADEAFMTEFSQVINSLDAGGFMHDYVKLIYELLGLTALDLSRVELDSVKEFRKTGNKSAIVDIIGRTIGANLRSGRGQAGLAEAIISNLRRKFDLSTDHALDEFKIPFSDPNIYNIILSTFVSNINRKSIKRQYPGLGTVMAPGYNMSMIYDLGGNTYQFEDLVNLAYSRGFNSALGDIANKNRDVVSLLLASELLKLPSYNNAEIFIPTDNVLINFTAEKFNLQGLNTNEVEYEVIREPWREDESKDDNDPTKRWKDVLKIYIKGHKEFGSFDLVKDQEFGFFSVHFKTGDADTGETYGSTPELRNILYLNLYNAIPEGAQVSTWGNISLGGVNALNKLMTRFTGEDRAEPIIANREIRDRQGNPIEVPVFLKFGSGLFKYEELTWRHESVSLDDIDDYYSFKADPIAYLKKLGYYNISNVTFLKNIMVPRNLAPAKVSYEYNDETGHHYSNIFDHWRVASLYKALNYINNSKKLSADLITEATLLLTNAINDTNSVVLQTAISKLGVNDINNTKELANILRKYYNPDLAFRELKAGHYIKSDGTSYNITNLLNLPAELIMSNIYKTAFGIKDGDSLIDVMNKGVNYFLNTPKIISSSNFDLVYTRNDNKHLYITFKPLPYNSDNFDSSRRSWKNTIRRREPDGDVVNRIYATTDNNVIMFEVGREILRDDVVYDSTLEKFTLNGNILKHLNKYRIDGDKVLEYVEFVSNNVVSETNGDKHSRYRLYNINKDNIVRAFNRREYTKEELLVNGHEITPNLKFDSEVNNYISKLLADIYNTDAFNGVLVNSDMSSISGDIVNKTLYNLGENLKYDQDLSKYIKSIKTDILDKTKPNPKNGRYQIKRNKLNDKLREFTYNLASKKYASFLKSLYFTASRIPALNLQSFMKMKCVGFTGIATGQCFVSHWQTWLQGSDYDIDKAYIMGLSFDGNGKYVGWSTLFDHSTLATLEASEWLPYPKKILFDKVEQGYSIDNYKNLRKDLINKIHQWQDLLKQEGLSEDLLLELYANIDDAVNQLHNSGLDINNDIINIQTLENNIEADLNRINEINSTIRTVPQELRDLVLQERDILLLRINNTRVQRMNALATLLNNINSVTNKVEDRLRVNLYYTVPNANKVIQELRDHEFTNIPMGLLEQASKNFISSHIQNTILDLSNMVRAYSPVEMEDLRDASSLSTKGEQAAKMTMLNPATKMLMQYANMTGKNVIGIGANGIKATFMWTYYLNEVVRNNPTERDLKYATFSFKLDRVVGRADNKVRSVEINTLPGVNFNGVDPLIRARFGNILEGPISTDNMQSLFLSAATDNAKELILAKINAGNKLAKMYLFLMSLGVDVRDIVKFMTSDVASFIDLITEENIYDNYHVSIYAAIDMARGNFKNYINTYGKEVIDEIKELYDEYGLGTPEKKNDAIRDADEFKNILEGADEFSRFGQLLGMNQGLATSETDLRKSLALIQNIVSSRLKEVENVPKDVAEKLSQPIDVAKWASDANYRDELKELYNKIKKCNNIFDAFDRISLFDAIRLIFDAIITIDDNLTIKTKAYIKLLDKARKDDLTLPDKYSTRLLRAVDYAIISNFISSLNIKIPVVKDSTNLSSDAEILKFAEDGEIPIKTKSGAATFKYIFENVIIPKLLKGITQDYINGKVEETQHPELLTNPFVLSLLKASYRDVPLYKANLNMLTIENSTESQRKYNLYTKGLQELSNIFINGTSVSDLFMLYNLIVNKNLYGADRLTTLFDKIIANDLDSLLKDYFKYLGDLDFFGEVVLDTDPLPDNDYYKTLEAKNLLLKIGYKDSLITAANIVSSTVGQRDPYIKVNTEKGVVLMLKNGRSYEEVKDFIRLKKGEDADHYFSRVVNYNSYFVLGESFSDNLTKELREITNFGENALNYINDFIQQGILTINKVCE